MGARELGVSEERLRRIDAMVQGFIDRRQIAGAVTMLTRRGVTVQHRNYGSLDLELERAMPLDALFRLYSQTKPLTTIAVLQLFEEGHFLLDDPIADFFPEFATTRVYSRSTVDTFSKVIASPAPAFALTDLVRPITIWHLLTHTSGLAYSFNFAVGHPLHATYTAAGLDRYDETSRDKIRRIATMPLAFQPGEGWTYGVSLDVLGGLVEHVSGMSLDRYLATRILQPLGMHDTGFAIPPEKADRVATIYHADAKGLTKIDWDPRNTPALPTWLSGGEGLFSTAKDLTRFFRMWLAGGTLDGTRILGRKAVELMTASQHSQGPFTTFPADWAARDGYKMGLGIRTLVDVAASQSLGSAGSITWQGLTGSDYWADPKEELIGMFMVAAQPPPAMQRPAQLFRTLAYAALE